MAYFNDRDCYWFDDDRIPHYRCVGDTYRDKVKNNLSFDHIIHLENMIEDQRITNTGLECLPNKKKFNSNPVILPDTKLDLFKHADKEKKLSKRNTKKKKYKFKEKEKKKNKKKQLKYHRLLMATIIDDNGLNDFQIECIYDEIEDSLYKKELEKDIALEKLLKKSTWGAKIYNQFRGVTENIQYDPKLDVYKVNQYPSYRSNRIWNTQNWIPSNELIYTCEVTAINVEKDLEICKKLLAFSKIFHPRLYGSDISIESTFLEDIKFKYSYSPRYEIICEKLELMRINSNRKAYRQVQENFIGTFEDVDDYIEAEKDEMEPFFVNEPDEYFLKGIIIRNNSLEGVDIYQQTNNIVIDFCDKSKI